LGSRRGGRADAHRSRLEKHHFGVEVSQVAEAESWRKELYRPATYVHKWWARRLGSVFREIMLASVDKHESPRASEALLGKIVLDPFAGSGTTLVEARKLGARVIGRDINPVATLTQRQAIALWSWETIQSYHDRIRRQVATDINSYYLTSDGRPILFYFWVSVAHCPTCDEEVELFSSYVFARHAYLSIRATGQATCPSCHAVCPIDLTSSKVGHCEACQADFDLAGPVRGRHMVCRRGHRSEILGALNGTPPPRRMFAKLVLNNDKTRTYLPIDESDLRLYNKAARALADRADELVLPEGQLSQGVNTIQALRWGYSTWRSFYNQRQLLCLGLLAQALKELPSGHEREALIAAFSKTVENNNLFCSYKGEGSGPVRSVFHNHVLRPERVSVEGNPWGDNGGSGNFADALRRLRRAHKYKRDPTDLVLESDKVVSVSGHSCGLESAIVSDWTAFVSSPASAYVVTGDAARTDLPARSVDLIVTDPPYVDNVHYAELADFFHAWMRSMQPFAEYGDLESTRNVSEVQNTETDGFQRMITRVLKECHRVLKDDGLLVFSFHQSTTSGWSALMRALRDARFEVTATRPVVAEVMTSLSKLSAREPNRIDVIVVARKRIRFTGTQLTTAGAANKAALAIRSIDQAGLTLGVGDARTAVRAAVLAQGSQLKRVCWERLESAADHQAELAAQRMAKTSTS
jgi:putative DNA methylase